jgi:hypothetical protein
MALPYGRARELLKQVEPQQIVRNDERKNARSWEFI